MSNALITNSTLTDIADAIRAKGGASGKMLPSAMPGNIRNISGGGSGAYQQKTVHPQLSQQIVSPDSGYDALSQVTVEAIELQSKTTSPSPTEQTIKADDGKDGLSSVVVSAATLQDKQVAPGGAAQTITPDPGYYGLSSVEVAAVPDVILQSKTVSPQTTAQTITPDAGYAGLSDVTVEAATLQEKSVTLGSTAQEITPDSGNYGLSKVNVPAAPTFETQSKAVHPSTSQQTVTPDSGIDGLSSVVVEAMQLQTKSVTPSASPQTVAPDSGYDGLSSVAVGAASPTTLTTKTITANGTYKAEDDNSDGYSEVDVNVAGSQIVLLWENPNGTVQFATKTIELDLTDYSAVIIVSKWSTSNPDSSAVLGNSSSYFPSTYINKGFSGYIVTSSTPAQNATCNLRTVDVSNTGVAFGTGRSVTSYSVVANGGSIPMKIYGVTSS